MKPRNIVILVLVIVIAAAATAAAVWYRRERVPIVTAEVIRTRDLDAVVSASGKIQPKRLVNISADTRHIRDFHKISIILHTTCYGIHLMTQEGRIHIIEQNIVLG